MKDLRKKSYFQKNYASSKAKELKALLNPVPVLLCIINVFPFNERLNSKWEFFFLIGLIWGSTVFCIHTWNITLINMVKLHLTHMYIYVHVFVDRFKGKKNFNLFYSMPKLFNTFEIIRDLLKTFASNSLGQILTSSRILSAFFCGFDYGASRFFRSL